MNIVDFMMSVGYQPAGNSSYAEQGGISETLQGFQQLLEGKKPLMESGGATSLPLSGKKKNEEENSFSALDYLVQTFGLGQMPAEFQEAVAYQVEGAYNGLSAMEVGLAISPQMVLSQQDISQVREALGQGNATGQSQQIEQAQTVQNPEESMQVQPEQPQAIQSPTEPVQVQRVYPKQIQGVLELVEPSQRQQAQTVVQNPAEPVQVQQAQTVQNPAEPVQVQQAQTVQNPAEPVQVQQAQTVQNPAEPVQVQQAQTVQNPAKSVQETQLLETLQPEISAVSESPSISVGYFVEKITAEQSGAEEQAGQYEAQPDTPLQPDQKDILGEAAVTVERPLFDSLDHIPIKVGDGQVLDATSADFEVNLAGRVSQALEQGAERIELHLSPENLGDVVVELTREPDGLLRVVLSADNERAARLLGEHSSALGIMLQNSGQGEVRVEVPQPQQEEQPWQQPDQQQGQQQQGQSREQQNRKQSNDDFLQQIRLGLFQLEMQQV